MPTATLSKKGPSYEYTATGVLGDKRTTMLINELHLRSELGKTKGHGHNLGDTSGQAFGRSNPPRDKGVAGALVWPEPKVSKKSKQSRRSKSKSPSKRDLSPDQYYGQPARPSTPINDILTFKYQNDWIAQQLKAQKAHAKEAHSKKVIPGAYRENHTSTLRYALRQPEVEDGSLWQMSKFSNNAHREIDTFRSESARERSFKNQDLA